MIPPALAGAVDDTAPVDPPLVQAAGPGFVRIAGQRYVNLASCDYLGLARHPAVLAAAADTLDVWGLGSAATRVLSGSSALHRQLEAHLGQFVGTEDTVLHGSCWSANAAVFCTLAELARRSNTTLAVFSDRLNHASLIDAIRTVRPQVSHLSTYDHHGTDPEDGIGRLRARLEELPGSAARVIVTDGVFSMEGDQAPLRRLVDLAREFEALLVVDDSHGTGVLGPRGRGSAEAQQVLGEVDVITGTLGKALGGAIGGFVAAAAPLTAAVRSLSRPYVFSNNQPYPVVAAVLAALDVLERDPNPLTALRRRTARLREGIDSLRLRSVPGEHPIVPLILGDEGHAVAVSRMLRQRHVYVTPITFPLVGRGEARIRMQVSAAHTADDIERVIRSLTGVDHARPSTV